MWWGFSQALDLLEEYGSFEQTKQGGGDSDKDTYNVLLIGQCDGRHHLKTIAQKYRHSQDINVNLYIYEPLLENVARQLLFTTLALEPAEQIGLADKTWFFMELYGNTLLRPSTSRYLTKISKRLLNFVTNLNFAERILPSVHLNNLKYKERDQLEIIFKYWATCDKSFDILRAWDERLRKQLGVRYDSRTGVYDWDYHMRYHCYGADVLKLQEYKKFREKGVAFYFEDTDPCVPNCTLASAIFSAGSKLLSYGYLGDIVTGPYVSFGLSCEDQDMLKRVNGQMKKSATDVTERNLVRMFCELRDQKPYSPHPEIDDGPLAILMDSSSKLKIMESEQSPESNQIRIKDACEIYTALSTNNCNLIFLPTTALNDLSSKLDYENFFDLAYISQTTVLKYSRPEMFKMFKPGCKIIVDTPKFLLNYRKEDLEKFKSNLVDLMRTCQSNLMGPYNSEKDEFVRFQVEK